MSTLRTSRAVSASPVPEYARPGFLPRHFGRATEQAALVYNLMARMAGDYRGGFWEFYELTNGGFYMAPVAAPRWRLVTVNNAFDGVLSCDAAGVVVTLRALARLALVAEDERLAEQAVVDYYRLRAFADELSEAPLIFAAVH